MAQPESALDSVPATPTWEQRTMDEQPRVNIELDVKLADAAPHAFRLEPEQGLIVRMEAR